MKASEDLQKRILIVEDESLIAADLARRIARLGYPPPAIAPSGEEALARARATRFDLVLMDVRLRGEMDGVAAAAALQSEMRTPVVFVTAHADEETIERAKFTEPLGYLLKPVSDADLRIVIRNAIHKATMERRLLTGAAWLATTLRSVGAVSYTHLDVYKRQQRDRHITDAARPQIGLQSCVRIDLAILGALRLVSQCQLQVRVVEALARDQLV